MAYPRAGKHYPGSVGEFQAWFQVVTNCLALLAIGLIPTLMGLAGSIYFFTAFVVGIVFLGYGVRFAIFRSTVAARRLLLASYLYIPLQLGMMSFDKLPF